MNRGAVLDIMSGLFQKIDYIPIKSLTEPRVNAADIPWLEPIGFQV